ncbi:MAG: amino acid permease, partial [Planctomycetes bacterium]|nr:amino acid permease [Planctomycetota bacterium]
MSSAVDPSGDSAGSGARDAPRALTLPRELGLRTAVAVVAGAIIGASIFRVPATIAAEVGGGGAILALWGLGALIAIAGALSLAELAAAYPNTGGMYVYLRETYGRWAAFLFGWAMLVVNSASYAGLALLLGQSVALLAPSARGCEREIGLASLLLLVV